MRTFRICRFRRTPAATNTDVQYLGRPWRATVRELRAALRLNTALSNTYVVDPDGFPLRDLGLNKPVVLVRGLSNLLVERVR